MADDEKPKLSSQTSEDDEVLGFADKPFWRVSEPTSPLSPPPTLTGRSPESGADRMSYGAHQERPATSESDEDLEDTPVDLRGWIAFVEGVVVIFALIIPWTASMIISWMPLTKISVNDAPKMILLGLISSAIETGSLFLVFIGTGCFHAVVQSPKPTPKFLDMLFTAWIWFLLLDPVATGIVIWDWANDISCGPDSDSPECHVGKGLIRAIGIFRVFGVIGTLIITGVFQTRFAKKMRQLQRRKNRLSQNESEA